MSAKKTATQRDRKRGAAREEGPELSFEDALERLEGLVARLEEGEVPLEESVEAYAEGMSLVKTCLARLEAAEATVRELNEAAGEFRLEESRLAGDAEDPEDDDA